MRLNRARPACWRARARIDARSSWAGSQTPFKLASGLQDEPFLVGAPAPGEGFFYLHVSKGKKGSWGTTALRHATKGNCVQLGAAILALPRVAAEAAR